jgi:hypothetical protein
MLTCLWTGDGNSVINLLPRDREVVSPNPTVAGVEVKMVSYRIGLIKKNEPTPSCRKLK